MTKLSGNEIRKLYLDKIDTYKLHTCMSFRLDDGVDKMLWNWDLVIHKNIYNENGMLSQEYFSPKNKAIFDSTKLKEEEIYEALRNLVKEYPRQPRIKPKKSFWYKLKRLCRRNTK